MQYRTFRTQAGFSLEAAMVAKGEKLVLSHMALGDGGGASYEPDSSQTSLKNEITRFKLNDLSQKKDDPTSWFAEGICPEDQGGFTIREAGLFTEDGTLYAIASLPEQYRPSASDGVIGQFVLRMNFKSANTQNITLNLDKNIITATKKWVEEKLDSQGEYLDRTYIFSPGGEKMMIQSFLVTCDNKSFIKFPVPFSDTPVVTLTSEHCYDNDTSCIANTRSESPITKEGFVIDLRYIGRDSTGAGIARRVQVQAIGKRGEK